MSGEQLASTATHIRVNSWLHLAGIPPQFLVPDEAPLATGFTGCMQDLQVFCVPPQCLENTTQLLQNAITSV